MGQLLPLPCPRNDLGFRTLRPASPHCLVEQLRRSTGLLGQLPLQRTGDARRAGGRPPRCCHPSCTEPDGYAPRSTLPSGSRWRVSSARSAQDTAASPPGFRPASCSKKTCGAATSPSTRWPRMTRAGSSTPAVANRSRRAAPAARLAEIQPSSPARVMLQPSSDVHWLARYMVTGVRPPVVPRWRGVHSCTGWRSGLPMSLRQFVAHPTPWDRC